MSRRIFIFPLSTGRSGTVYLAEALKANLPVRAAVYHERTGFDRFGVDTPDLSTFTLFNSVGNVPRVRCFWETKAARVIAEDVPVYAEISHFLMKAGLVENLDLFLQAGDVHLVHLTRDVAQTVRSLVNADGFCQPAVHVGGQPRSTTIPAKSSQSKQLDAPRHGGRGASGMSTK